MDLFYLTLRFFETRQGIRALYILEPQTSKPRHIAYYCEEFEISSNGVSGTASPMVPPDHNKETAA